MILVVSSFTRRTPSTIRENGRSLTPYQVPLSDSLFLPVTFFAGPLAVWLVQPRKRSTAAAWLSTVAAAADTRSKTWRQEEECWDVTKSNYQRDANEVNKKKDHHQQARAREDRLFRRQRQHTIHNRRHTSRAKSSKLQDFVDSSAKATMSRTKDDWSESAAMLIETRTYREINSSNDVPGRKNKMGSKAKTKTK